MSKEDNYDWMFSNTEFDNGTIDIHFLLNKTTGDVKKVVQRRTGTSSKEELYVCGLEK